ncbi:MAG TPA: TonB-dependent receptor [Croceibacterium sp.]
MQRSHLILLAMVAAPQAAAAQDSAPGATDAEEQIVIADTIRESYITILATGTRQYLLHNGQSIAAFERADIESVQGPDLTRLLERSPGVTFSRNGGPGSFTGVRVRGAEGEQLLVLLDGVRVADTASPGGGFDFGNLLMGNLAKVELQRSSNSTIWGSQALGGVLAATTDSSEAFSTSLEYGDNDTVYATAGAGLSAGPATLSVRAGHYTTEGFSSAAGGTEADGFRQTELAGRAEVTVLQGLSAFVTGRAADGRLEIDGFPAPAFTLADTAEYQETRQRSGAAGVRYWSTDLELQAAASIADTERDSFDPAFGPDPNYTTDGESERGELRGRWSFAQHLALDFGAEKEWQRFSSLFDPLRETAIGGGYAQLDYDGRSLHLAAGVRRDEHRDFGGEWSFGADAAWDLEPVRLTASYGEGFKAPTLFQLHSDFGNAALAPERSQSFDAGASVNIGSVTLGLTAFRRDTEDLIGFVSCFGVATGICTGRPFGTYDNIGQARAQGFEAQADVQIGYFVTFGAAYTLLDAEDRTPGSATEGNDLARRPKHTLTLTGDWRPSDEVSLGADLRVVSDSYDDAFNTVPLDGYATLALRGEWDANEWVTLFGRVENVWDEDYQTAAGYATEGRAAHIGARARF